MRVTSEIFRTQIPHPNELKKFVFSQTEIKICAQNALLSIISVQPLSKELNQSKSKIIRIINPPHLGLTSGLSLLCLFSSSPKISFPRIKTPF